MGVSALLRNCINYGFSLSVFPKPAVSGPGREKGDVCDSCHFTKWEPWWGQLHQSAPRLQGLGCSWRLWAWQTLRASSYPMAKDQQPAALVNWDVAALSTRLLSSWDIPVLGMGEQSCAELRGTGAPWTGNAAMQLQSSLYGLTRKKLNQRQHISKGSFLPCVLMFP